MATITSNATGFYDVGGTWVGGIVPVEGDKVIIASGHVVTIRDTRIAGDDTTTAFTITGTLFFSRIANSSLTVKGDLIMSAATTATLDMGRFSTTDPIPAGITATLILNYSAAMVNYKYGLFIAESANAYFCGATRTRNTTIITSGISAGATSVVLADITGWTVGDWIILGETTGVMAQYDRVQIATITPGTGTTGTVTFSALGFAHALGGPVCNFSSNVTIKSFNTTNPAYFCCRYTSTASNNRRELDYVTFEYVGSDVSLTSTKVFVASGLSTEANPFKTFTSCSFYQGNNSVGLFMNQLNTTVIYKNHCFFSDVASAGACIYTASGTYIQLEDSVFIYMKCVGHNSGYSQGGQGATFRRCKFWANGANYSVNLVNGSGIEYIDCQQHSSETTGTAFALLGSGDATFTRHSFGGPELPGTPACGWIADTGSVSGQVGTFRLNDCTYMTPSTSFYRRLTTANPKYATYVSNKNNDPLVQEVYTPNGIITRDNTTKFSGVTTCVKMSPTSATNALTFTRQVPAQAGVLVAVNGKLNRDTANTTTVTLSGLGITTSTYTASASTGTNETYLVTGTPTTTGLLTLTISTTGASGNLWVGDNSAPQAVAINLGQDSYWSGAVPAGTILANVVTGGDVWNYPLLNVNVSNSIGIEVRNISSKVS